MAKKITLSDRFIQSRKPAEKGRRDDYADAIVPGLVLRVTDSGHKSFVLYTRYPTNPKIPARRALGTYYASAGDQVDGAVRPAFEIRNGALTLAEAREKARGWLDLISRGIDPRAHEERLKAAEIRRQNHTFGAVAEEYLAIRIKGPAYVSLEELAKTLIETDPSLQEIKPKLRFGRALSRVMGDPKNLKLVERSKAEGITKKAEADRIIRHEFIDRWDARPISDITSENVASAIREMVKRDASFQAHNAFGYLRGLFNWAIGTGQYGLVASPLERLKPAELIGAKKARSRTLANDEIRDLWVAAGEMGYPYGPLIRLLLLTGQRENEIAEARWSEIEMRGDLMTIPAVRMKAERAHEVPFGDRAKAIFKSLPRWSRGDFIFSTTSGDKPVNGWSKAKVRLDKLIATVRAKRRTGEGDSELLQSDYLAPWVFHDIRRTVRTHFSALPVEETVRELVIAHAQKGLSKVYDLHAYQEGKRECLKLWEERLAGILAPPQD